MKKPWNKDDVLNVKLRDTLFTLAQVPISPYQMVFGKVSILIRLKFYSAEGQVSAVAAKEI
jgi:hypothetical protein